MCSKIIFQIEKKLFLMLQMVAAQAVHFWIFHLATMHSYLVLWVLHHTLFYSLALFCWHYARCFYASRILQGLLLVCTLHTLWWGCQGVVVIVLCMLGDRKNDLTLCNIMYIVELVWEGGMGFWDSCVVWCSLKKVNKTNLIKLLILYCSKDVLHSRFCWTLQKEAKFIV